MKKYGNVFLVVFLILISSYTAYKISFFVGEKYFFDKLFYKKSAMHGYNPRNGKINRLLAQSRIKDLAILNNYLEGQVKGISSDNNKQEFTVLIIGDSYSYGLGLRPEDTLPNILEAKLDSELPTRVINLSYPNDNIFNHFIKYQAGKIVWQPDVVIFGLGINDLLWGNTTKYPSTLYNEIEQLCPGDFIFDYYQGENYLGENDSWDDYLKVIEKTYQFESKNMCAFLLLLEKLPIDNSLYFYIDSLWDPDSLNSNEMMVLLKQRGFKIVELWNYEQQKEKYPRGWVDLKISEKESHINKTAHEIIAEKLFLFIKSNYLQ